MYSDAKFLPVSKNANPLFLSLDKGGEFWNISMSDERCETDLGADFAELRSRLLSSVPPHWRYCAAVERVAGSGGAELVRVQTDDGQ